MSFKSYIETSIADPVNVNLERDIANIIGERNIDYGWIRLDVEIELVRYDTETRESEIIASWIAESRRFYRARR